MSHKQVQEGLYTQPKEDPATALQFTIAFEEGLRKKDNWPTKYALSKGEPVFVDSGQRDKRECWRCGAGNFTAAHLKVCKALETHCNYCGIKGHFEKCCNSKQKNKLKKIANPKNFDRNLQIAKGYKEWTFMKTIKIQRVTKWYSMSKVKELKTPLRITWKGGLMDSASRQ